MGFANRCLPNFYKTSTNRGVFVCSGTAEQNRHIRQQDHPPLQNRHLRAHEASCSSEGLVVHTQAWRLPPTFAALPTCKAMALLPRAMRWATFNTRCCRRFPPGTSVQPRSPPTGKSEVEPEPRTSAGVRPAHCTSPLPTGWIGKRGFRTNRGTPRPGFGCDREGGPLQRMCADGCSPTRCQSTVTERSPSAHACVGDARCP